MTSVFESGKFRAGDKVRIMNHWGYEYGTVVRSNHDNLVRDEDGEYLQKDMLEVKWRKSTMHSTGDRGFVSASHFEPMTEAEWSLLEVMDS